MVAGILCLILSNGHPVTEAENVNSARVLERQRLEISSQGTVELLAIRGEGGKIVRLNADRSVKWQRELELTGTRPLLPRGWTFGRYLIVEQPPAPTMRYPILGVKHERGWAGLAESRRSGWRFLFIRLDDGKAVFEKSELALGIPIGPIQDRYLFAVLTNPDQAYDEGLPERWRFVLRDERLVVRRQWDFGANYSASVIYAGVWAKSSSTQIRLQGMRNGERIEVNNLRGISFNRRTGDLEMILKGGGRKKLDRWPR